MAETRPKRKAGTKSTKPSAATQQDPLATAVELWGAVVAGLRQAQYAEVGQSYAQLSELLVQQRGAELVAHADERPEWASLQEVAAEALRLLEPVTTAARRLAELPRRVDPDTTAAPRDAAHPSRVRARSRRT